jgi:perosamine synthetase
MLRPIELTAAEQESLAHLLPAPDPEVRHPPAAEPGAPPRPLRVAETLLDGNELRYLEECIRTNWVSSAGPFVERFEQAFAAAVGCEHGVACANGTVALHLTLASLGIGAGDEVIVPTFAMIAVASAVTYTGATPVLVDSDPETLNLDPHLVAAAIGPRTRAVIAVHTYGHPAAMGPLRELCGRQGLTLVEDAAEAHGAEIEGRKVGSLARAATFSFYGNKIVTTGEGGMITTNDAELALLARRLRDHAFSPERHFWHDYLGFNYRMTNLQAAVGLAQTERLAELVAIRRRNAVAYSTALAGLRGLTLPVERPGCKRVFWMYALRVGAEFGCSRDVLRVRLAERGIETRTFFIPIHLQPAYLRAPREARFPIAEELCRTGLYLPSGPSLRASEIAYVAQSIRNAASPANVAPAHPS